MAFTSRHDRRYERLARVVVACVTLTAVACRKEDSSPADSTKVAAPAQSHADSAARSASASAPAANAYKPLGTLPRPLDDMLLHPDELMKLVDPDTRYTGQFVDRDCEGCKKGEHAKVHIGAIEDSWRVDYEALPPNGVIVGRITNYDKHKTEALYQIPPGATYYMVWVSAGSPKSALMKLIQRVEVAGRPTEFKLIPGFSQTVTHCVGHPKKFKPEADFANCAEKGDAQVSGKGLVLSPSKGPWLSCSQGCCTADAPPIGDGVGTRPAGASSDTARSSRATGKS